MTQQQKHTPGPWHVSDVQGKNTFTVYAREDAPVRSNWICQGPNVGAMTEPDEATCMANARLIASAPELLEALKELQTAYATSLEDSACNMIDASWRKARAAILKATGVE